ERDVRHVQRVVGEILLDEIALVAEADDEVVEAVGGVDLHDVPQDRPAADLDHRLRTEMRLFADARAHAAGEDHDLHGLAPSARTLQSSLGRTTPGTTPPQPCRLTVSSIGSRTLNDSAERSKKWVLSGAAPAYCVVSATETKYVPSFMKLAGTSHSAT